MFVMCVIYLCHIGVDCTSQNSLYQRVHFLHGKKIGTIGSVPDIHDCLRRCDNTCGYVQYVANGTCVLFSEALLLTEPANTTGQIGGYRKVSQLEAIPMFAKINLSKGLNWQTIR